MKLSMKSLLVKIYRKNGLHEAKFVSFPNEPFIAINKLVSSNSSVLGTGLFRRKIGSIVSVMLKIRIERNKTGKGYLDQNVREIMIDIIIVNYVLND